MFTMLNEEGLMLAKLASQSEFGEVDEDYWSLIDPEGQVKKIPE